MSSHPPRTSTDRIYVFHANAWGSFFCCSWWRFLLDTSKVTSIRSAPMNGFGPLLSSRLLSVWNILDLNTLTSYILSHGLHYNQRDWSDAWIILDSAQARIHSFKTRALYLYLFIDWMYNKRLSSSCVHDILFDSQSKPPIVPITFGANWKYISIQLSFTVRACVHVCPTQTWNIRFEHGSHSHMPFFVYRYWIWVEKPTYNTHNCEVHVDWKIQTREHNRRVTIIYIKIIFTTVHSSCVSHTPSIGIGMMRWVSILFWINWMQSRKQYLIL